MSVILAVNTLPHVSGLPADGVQNSFVFDGNALSAGATLDVVQGFNLVPEFFKFGVAEPALQTFISSQISRVAQSALVEYYDITDHLDGSSHGPPFASETWSLTAPPGAGTDLPSELAAVITLYGTGRANAPVNGPVSAIPNTSTEQLHGAPATHQGRTRPKQSLTGRLYVGPIHSSAMDTIGGEVRLTQQFLESAAQACNSITGDLEGSQVAWSVWSRKLAQVSAIFGGHIDNAVDIQRRRGVQSTVRQAWAA